LFHFYFAENRAFKDLLSQYPLAEMCAMDIDSLLLFKIWTEKSFMVWFKGKGKFLTGPSPRFEIWKWKKGCCFGGYDER